MDRRQSVVASVAEKAHPDVKIRDPALEFVMPGAMHPVRRADGGHGSGKFDDGDGGEEPAVLRVPEAMRVGRGFFGRNELLRRGGSIRGGLGFRRGRGSWRWCLLR